MNLLLTIALLAGPCFGAPEPEVYRPIINVVSLSEQDVSSLMKGQSSEMIVEFSQGTILPLHLFLKGDLFSVVGDEHTTQIEVKKTFYARCVQKEFLFSSNLTEWKPFLEFVTGTVSVAFATHEGQPQITLGADTQLRN